MDLHSGSYSQNRKKKPKKLDLIDVKPYMCFPDIWDDVIAFEFEGE